MIKRELVRLVAQDGVRLADLSAETSLASDLPLDSLKLVDLTLSLESVFELAEFDMQGWIDAPETMEQGFTITALAVACRATLIEQCRRIGGGEE
ncbi:MAG TPA: hypothetical protein VHC69_21295 [Polyangiaceae bacterium]|nr:hypothetical protein [Polyangiaceae bacterium]